MGPHMMMPGDAAAVRGKRLERNAVRRAWHFAHPYRRTIALFLGSIVVAAVGNIGGSYVSGGDIRLTSDADINASATACACAVAWVATASSMTTARRRASALTRSFYRATGRTREQYGDADEDG